MKRFLEEWLECSECGMGSDVDYNYCMRCGARMVKQGEEHD